MDCIAHRGFAAVNPENTLGALTAAAERADLVELDVRRCADGTVVVAHDETVDRVTGASGRVADLTADELASLDVLGSGEGIPTLAEACEALPAGAGLNVELKERGLAADVASAVDATDLGPVLVSSFDREALAEMRDASDLPLAYVFEGNPDDGIATALELGCEAVHPNWRLVDESLVERAHEAGLAVNAWTVEAAETARRVARAGADGVITDEPAFR